MRTIYSYSHFLAMSLIILASQNAIAGKIYQWIDEEGGVHFSDVAPENTATSDLREINIDIVKDDNVDPDEYSIINQLDRMAERRRQITEERLAVKKLQIEEMRVAQEVRQPVVISSSRYDPYIYSYGYPYPRSYISYRSRRFYNQPGYFLFPAMNGHTGWFSRDRRQSTRHYSGTGVRF